MSRDQKLAEYYGWLVCAASVRTAGVEEQTPIPCRRRPARRACDGHMVVMLTEVPEQVRWRCPSCGDEGQTGPWRHDVWNLREWATELTHTNELEMVISAEDYRVLRDCIAGPALVVASALLLPSGDILLHGDEHAMDDLLAAIAESPEDRVSARRRAILTRIYNRVDEIRGDAPQGGPFEGRALADALLEGQPADDRLEGFFRRTVDQVRVPFEASLGGEPVLVEDVFYAGGDPPEIRARTVFRSHRMDIHLAALEIPLSAGHVSSFASLYRSWWSKCRERSSGGRSRER